MIETLWTLLKKPGWLQRAIRTDAVLPAEHEVADWRTYRPDTKEDGAHISASPYYFEWWYFDVSYQADSALSVIFHMTDLIRPASSTGSINISILTHGRPPFHRFIQYPRDQIWASTEKCEVRVGNNRCWVEGERRYHIQIREAGLQIELEFEPLTISWRPGQGRVEFGRPEAFFAWVVPQPKARVTGWIQLNGDEREIEGIGYHDHNWGTVSLLDTAKHWSWGRIYLEELTCVYSDIHFSERYGGRRLMPFAVFDDKSVLISSLLGKDDPLDRQNDFLRSPGTVNSPSGWELAWQKGDEKLQISLRTREVLEKADLLSGSRLRKWLIGQLIAHPFYIRCLCSANALWEDGQRTRSLEGTAICEQISLQRE